MSSRELSLNTAACRLLQNIMPGLDAAVVFEEKVKLNICKFKALKCIGKFRFNC